jgi:hypothetical protein
MVPILTYALTPQKSAAIETSYSGAQRIVKDKNTDKTA